MGCDDGDDDDSCVDDGCDDMKYFVDSDDVGRSLGDQKLLSYFDALGLVSYCTLPIVEFFPCDMLRHDILELDIASFFHTAVLMAVALDLLSLAVYCQS